jgi:hypothetical protein
MDLVSTLQTWFVILISLGRFKATAWFGYVWGKRCKGHTWIYAGCGSPRHLLDQAGEKLTSDYFNAGQVMFGIPSRNQGNC